MTGNHHTGTRGWIILLLAVIMLAALGLRYRGIAWAVLHPDEPTIARWAHWIEDHPHIEDRFYAGGFFQLIKPVVMLRTQMEEWGLEWRAFVGNSAVEPGPVSSLIPFLRTINVWLATLTVFVFYRLGRRVSGAPVAALGAAAFLAFSRLHVDHSHYAETDVAMLLTLSVALALWAHVQDGAGRWWFYLAAFVSGWAIGTKFTTGVLLVCILTGAGAVSAPGRGRARLRRACGLGLAGILLCLAAVVYTNRGILNLEWFVPNAARGLASVYAERSGLLNQSAGDSAAAWISNWNTIYEGIRGMGWGWLAFMLVGLGRAPAAAYRRFWPVTLLFPGLYGAYCLFLAPWVRGQEFMALYAVCAAWLAIGLREVAALARRAPYPRAALAVVVMGVIAMTAASGIQACRSASQFGIPDPRIQAADWLATHAPLDAVTGIESYTTPVERLFSRAVDIGQIERIRSKAVDGRKLQYLLRNATSQGRGSVDPRTGELYPKYAANLQAFQSRAGLLCGWGLMGPSPYAFAGHRIQWWEVRRGPTVLDIAMPLYRPVLLNGTRSVMVPAAGCDLGSSPGLPVNRTARRMVVNGPAPDHRTLYVVLQTVDRPAEVTVRLSGGHGHATLGPYDVAVVPVRRPAWMPRYQEYDVVGIRARPEKDVGDIPCYAELAFSPAEAAQRLLQKGYPDRALAVLKAASSAGPEHAWLSYVCAVQEGDWALADRVEPAARALLTQLEQARAVAPESLVVNGHTGRALLQHRRVRLPVSRCDRHSLRQSSSGRTLELRSDEDGRPPYQANWRLPVRLTPGRYRIRLTLHAPRRGSTDELWALTLGDNTSLPAQPLNLATMAHEQVARDVEVGAETDYELRFSSPAQGGILEVSDAEIVWGGADLFQAERLELQKALIRHSLHRDDYAGAGALLVAARQDVPDDSGLDRLELKWRQTSGDAGTNVMRVARRILQAAPLDGAALAALAPVDEAARELWARLKDDQGPGLTLYPWLRLVRLATVPETGRRECVFEALRDGTPALKVRAWRRKNRRNNAYFSQPLIGRTLQRGERVRLEIPPSPESGAYEETWLTVESPPFWLSAPLSAPGLVKGRIPLQ